MKNTLIAGIVLALSVILHSACNNGQSNSDSQNTEAAVSGEKYICPMNCEKGKTYDKPGTCPVCNMKLELVKAEVAGNTAEYFTQYFSNPAQLEAGKPGLMSFTPKIKGNEGAPVPLDLVHEKKMHLILVSDDLSWFDHIHPEYQASGAYDIRALGKGESFKNGRGHEETRFESGGVFWAFTDYKPMGGLNQVNKTQINVTGAPSKTVAYTQPKMTATVDGYTLSLEAGHGGEGLISGNQQHIPVVIKKDGQPVDPATFENYLGEKAHLVLVEVATKEFVHTHPSATGGKLDIHTTFAQPGVYRGWLQFQTDGKVHTADFVLKVAKGQPGSEEQEEGHDHPH